MRNPKPRWYRPTPEKLLIALLAAEGLLLAADRFAWFGLTPGSGWNVLLAITLVAVVLLNNFVLFCKRLLLRQPFQFSIRALLILVVVCAIPCSWFAVRMNRARRQREAVKTIQELGGTVVYDRQMDEESTSLLAKMRLQFTWLRTVLGDDFLSEVIEVRLVFYGLEGPSCEDLSCLRELDRVRELRLQSPDITDNCLEHVREMSRLQKLYVWNSHGIWSPHPIGGTPVTDAGLEYLLEMRPPPDLSVSSSQVTDAGLKHLQGLLNLEYLSLRRTAVTDKGVAELHEALPNCKISY